MLKPLLLGVLVLLTGCHKQDDASRTGLIYCAEGSPQTFNPQVSNSGVTLDASSRPLYDRLLEVNPNTLALEGGLATRWQVSEDGLSYTLTLRQGVTFHHTPWFNPSRPLNADDVVFTWQRLLNKLHPYHEVSGGEYPYFYSLGLDQLIKRVYRKGADNVVFELNRPDASFLATLASDYAIVLSAEYAEQLQKAGTPGLIDSRPVGTGPFSFKEYRHNEYVRYLRHPGYWGGEAKIEQLIYDITPKSSKRLAKLLTGECDVMSTPSASQLSVIDKDPDLSLAVQSGMNVAFLALNTRKAPFNKVQVRQAIASAINIDNLLQAVYFETGQPANSLLPPLSWGYNPLPADAPAGSQAGAPAAQGGGTGARLRDAGAGAAGLARLQPGCPQDCPADAKRSGQNRHQAQNRAAGVAGHRGPSRPGSVRQSALRLDCRQRRPGQLLSPAAELRRRRARQQLQPLVQPGV